MQHTITIDIQLIVPSINHGEFIKDSSGQVAQLMPFSVMIVAVSLISHRRTNRSDFNGAHEIVVVNIV